MSDRSVLIFSWKDLVELIKVLDQYQLAIKTAKPGKDVSAVHGNIKRRILKLLKKNKKANKIPLPAARREWVYMKRIVFQYFIGLLKLGIEHDDKRYWTIHEKIAHLLGEEEDEIAKIIDMIENYKIGS